MTILHHDDAELEDAWIDGEPGARWRSAGGHGPGTGADASGSSLLEVPVGCRLPRHTDSAEEIVVVVTGEAAVIVGGERHRVPTGAATVIPADVPHEVHNDGDGAMRFLAIYASPEVVTRYEVPVQPGGDRERSPVG